MEDKEHTLIIGMGEIGKSLARVLDPVYQVFMRDTMLPMSTFPDEFRVVNICYPYSKDFVAITKDYIAKYKPALTIIHSTVKPGTTAKLGKGVVHSPVNGKHPNLEESIKTFVKFVGGNDVFSVFEAVNYLKAVGIKTQTMSNATTSELAKVLCTTNYSWNIVFMKEVAKLCNEFQVPFTDVYTEWNMAYNAGYSAMNEYRFIRPVLYPMPGKIGGHCCINNCHLLNNDITKFILEKNETY